MEFVEIGGLKWAICNVGAENPTDAGLYFQWGDRKGYTADEVGNIKRFNLHSYKHYNGNRYTKYNRFGGKRLLDLCDDAAFAYMGHGWRMPTAYDFNCLVRSATPLWTVNYKNSGVAGMLFTDRTDESKELFFPAVGYCYNGGVYYVGSHGYYWSGSLYSGVALYGRYLYFNSDGGVYWQYSSCRHFGFSVRGILTI
jgi:hypothetical protein